MTAEAISRALGGRRAGQGWSARCPAHDDREPSLSVRDAGGKVLVKCHAGCSQQEVIVALKRLGLWGDEERRTRRWVGIRKIRKTPDNPQTVDRSNIALSIWDTAIPIKHTLAETYLASRGLICSLPRTLRFHPGLKHPTGGVWPCMVALVARGEAGEPVAIHRTFLDAGGKGKAPVEPAKMMLGPCRGGSVRLREASDVLMVGEGIETCLSAMLATGNPAWAALSTSGLGALDLPRHVREVIVLADGDAAGESAARDSAGHWSREGRRVRIARPPQGLDFNDLLRGHAPGLEENAE